MNLIFKNKMLMAIDGMLKEGVERRGGIPKEIQITKEELVEFVKEVLYLRQEKKDGNLRDRANIADLVTIEYHDDTCKKLMFELNTVSPSKNTWIQLLTAWSTGKIKFHYKYNGQNIPIIIPKLKYKDADARNATEEKTW